MDARIVFSLIQTQLKVYIDHVTASAFRVHTNIRIDEPEIFWGHLNEFIRGDGGELCRVALTALNEFNRRRHNFNELGDACEPKTHKAKRLRVARIIRT